MNAACIGLWGMARLPLVMVALWVIVMLAACTKPAAHTLEIEQARIQPGPPGATVFGAFLVIHNRSRKPAVLTGVKASGFAVVEMHRTVVEKQIARMEKQDRITVPAGQSLEFKHGGYHLMLMDPKKTVKAGERFELFFIFESTEVKKVVPVKP